MKKEIEMAKMPEKDKNKPAEILEKIMSGKVSKIVNEVTLYGQPFVLNTDVTVEAALKAAGADVIGFQRLVTIGLLLSSSGHSNKRSEG